jgi:hypothetical protein
LHIGGQVRNWLGFGEAGSWEMVRTAILNLKGHMNPMGVLFKYRLRFSRSAVQPEI